MDASLFDSVEGNFMTQRTKALGVNGEEIAARYLEAAGYRIVERNYRIRAAEIDLIAERDGVIVFVEVKTRLSMKYGRPSEAVTLNKQRKIIMAASVFMQQEEYAQRACRFDVIEIMIGSGDCRINQIENAFEVSG